MATRKAKRYDDGGVTEGQNANIDDDTRARALKWVQQQSEEASSDEGSGEKTVSRSTKTKATAKPAAKADPRDAEAGKSRGIPGDGVPKTTKSVRMATDSRGIPTRELKSGETQADYDAAAARRSKEPVGPNSASGSELERNVTNALNALTPGGARAARVGSATVKGVRELVESRQAAKAAQAAREARDAKVLNPNAWMAGPKGMKENFKSGGNVKGWGIARGARKAKTY